METEHAHKSYFTRTEVARLFEVAPNTISRWVRDGRLPFVRTPGGRRRYPVELILRLVQQFREEMGPGMAPRNSPAVTGSNRSNREAYRGKR